MTKRSEAIMEAAKAIDALSDAIEAQIPADFVPRDYIRITFQDGPVLENGVNGCQTEDVIELLIERLEGFEAGPYNSFYNRQAIQHLRTALDRLNARTRDRVRRGVEGRNVA